MYRKLPSSAGAVMKVVDVVTVRTTNIAPVVVGMAMGGSPSQVVAAVVPAVEV